MADAIEAIRAERNSLSSRLQQAGDVSSIGVVIDPTFESRLGLLLDVLIRAESVLAEIDGTQ